MRWLVGWSSTAARFGTSSPGTGDTTGSYASGSHASGSFGAGAGAGAYATGPHGAGSHAPGSYAPGSHAHGSYGAGPYGPGSDGAEPHPPGPHASGRYATSSPGSTRDTGGHGAGRNGTPANTAAANGTRPGGSPYHGTTAHDTGPDGGTGRPGRGGGPGSSRPGGIPGPPDGAPADDGPALQPVGGQLLWGGPDPLWAVGDWRPDEIRVVTLAPDVRLAVLGCCAADDDALKVGLLAARGGAIRHLTAWPGSYTAVVMNGRRITVTADLAGARPVFHTPWAGGTAYATAALPLADLIEAQLDVGHLAALLACPEVPEALGDSTPYTGVRRVPPGHALVLREGSREITGYEAVASLAVAAPQRDPDQAVEAVRDALVEAVRARLTAPRHAPAAPPPDPGPVPGMGPADRRAARGAPTPVPGIGADLSGGSASSTLALLAAGLPGVPGIIPGTFGTFGAFDTPADHAAARSPEAPPPPPGPPHPRDPLGATGHTTPNGTRHGTHHGTAHGSGHSTHGTAPGPTHTTRHTAEAGERLLAVTFNDLTANGHDPARTAELERARTLAENPRLHHVVVAAGEEALPYADLDIPLTDEPGPALVTAVRHRLRLAAGSADHLTGHGARQVLDAHPARLADLLMDRRRRHLLRPVTALAKASGASAGALLVPLTVYRAARKLARTPYRSGLEAAAARLASGPRDAAAPPGGPEDPAAGSAADGARHPAAVRHGPVDASLAALTWARPGPAARWLTGEALADVAARLHQAAGRLTPVHRPGEARARAALTRHAADHRVLEQAAEIRSQRLHAPFLDNQVVRACRDLPESLRVRPGARADILRAVLAGSGIHHLPPGWGATSHAPSATAAHTGLRAALPHLLALFDAPLLADAGLIEARVVRRALRDAADSGSAAADDLDGLADLISTELWLRRLLARRGTCWTGTGAPRQRAAATGIPHRPPRPGIRA
ncbi:asparagine synthase-related protein [Streptomyces sp. CC228A]|uniref:asparagine synthase-related protein n=1 Tax=Streptomyces sp. CC228A TaxID=2898186 RepID=UPI001F2E6C38|nr:asparagine synthase-related protein [Streptomyces sp. CC228A]